ncbi:MAG: hypothetical protein A2V65_08655 [Deltaproteobacteria bacterium RBG_13_49_15]|nr:MAG: hypothetical protein A2V65_08655 [Deltaproteobacteria bacterium RBG_13_49_15]
MDKVLSHIDTEELIDLTGRLVCTNTVWDPAAGTSEEPAAKVVAEWASGKGFDVRWDEVAPGRPNIIIRWQAGPGKRTLMFEGHTDVVTPGDASAWSFDPFGGQIAGRRMYGRGANDTKGNLAAMLIAMAALKRSGVRLAGTIVGGVLCDEEDQMLGVQDFIDRGHADKVTAAVICEPQDGLICCTQKGALRACFTITGRMSHGAIPLSGLNSAPAVSRLIDGLHLLELEAIKAFGKDKYLGWPSFTPTVIQAPARGAPQLNVIPGLARILVDIRTVPNQSHPKIITALNRLASETGNKVLLHYEAYDRLLNLDRNRNLHILPEVLSDRPCTLTDINDPVVTAADWATRRITGGIPEYAGVPGATDGTFLWAQKKIPIVTMGAGDRHVPHQVDEWVDLDQLAETARIYALTALRYLMPQGGK